MEANPSARNYETLSSSIQAELGRLPPFPKGSSISRAPKQLRQVNEAAFAPLILSIGPLYHKHESFLPMEALKLNYLKPFLAASSANADLTAFLHTLTNCESKIRNCYTDPIHLSTDEFTRMVLVDGAFIIELFRKSFGHFCSLSKDGDPFSRGSREFAALRRDLQLAENQLPSFILVDLYWMAFKPVLNGLPTFSYIASEFFGLDRRNVLSRTKSKEMDNKLAGRHLLDLSKNQYTYGSAISCSPATRGKGKIRCPTATRLFEAGVKFRVRQPRDGIVPSFDVSTRELFMPELRLTHELGVSLRNSIAFEQSDSGGARPATEYAFFLDCLIDTARDVELLVEAEVVENFIGDDEEAAKLINSLCKHVDLSSCFLPTRYGDVCAMLNKYYAKSWNRHRAKFEQKYFNHPWAAISVVYAFVMLLLAIAQVMTGAIFPR